MRYIPSSVQSGATFKLTLALSRYPASDWEASLILRGPETIDIDSEADDDQHTFEVSAEDTKDWKAGQYWYCLRVTKDDEVRQIEEGTIEVKPDLDQVTGVYDGRDHVQKVLDAIEAVIEGRASKDQESYKINNRELRRTSITDLLLLRDRYKRELERQHLANRNGNSLLGRPVRVRMP